MNYYQEIRLLPDAESSLGFIWQKVYQQIHIALADNKIGENHSAVALSIPGYVDSKVGIRTFPLGDTLRLFAESEQALKELNIAKWLVRLEDYAQVKSIKPVPDDCRYACFTRKTVKGEKRILAKAKQMAEYKAGETGEPAEKWFKHYRQESATLSSHLPFVQINRSQSEQEQGKSGFKLFIDMQMHDAPKNGKFNCYGLSYTADDTQATVPWF